MRMFCLNRSCQAFAPRIVVLVDRHESEVSMIPFSANPLSRYPDDRDLQMDTGNWVVAHLKSRQDKAFAHDLMREEIPYYMPLLEKRSRQRGHGRVLKSLLPLFPGYIAVSASADQWERLYKHHRVAQLIPVLEQEDFTHELQQVHALLASQWRIEVAPLFAEGQPVRVKSGPMMGLEGMVTQYQGDAVFVIRVKLFHQSIRVEIEDAYLEPIA